MGCFESLMSCQLYYCYSPNSLIIRPGGQKAKFVFSWCCGWWKLFKPGSKAGNVSGRPRGITGGRAAIIRPMLLHEFRDSGVPNGFSLRCVVSPSRFCVGLLKCTIPACKIQRFQGDLRKCVKSYCEKGYNDQASIIITVPPMKIGSKV